MQGNVFLFVGEKPSTMAWKNNWTWRDGRLAAKQLWDALRMIGISPENQDYCNLWTYDGKELPFHPKEHHIIVAMGNIVCKELCKRKIPHLKIIHPAARGKIRNKKRYAMHLKQILKGKPPSNESAMNVNG